MHSINEQQTAASFICFSKSSLLVALPNGLLQTKNFNNATIQKKKKVLWKKQSRWKKRGRRNHGYIVKPHAVLFLVLNDIYKKTQKKPKRVPMLNRQHQHQQVQRFHFILFNRYLWNNT